MKIINSALILLFFFSGCSQNPEKKIDRLFSDYKGNQPGASVMVIKDGQPVIIKSYGMADLEKGVPVTPATNFRLASVTKQFTAKSIMLLVKENKLQLNQTLCDIFPGFPEYGRKISLVQLLNHTSGLVAYEEIMPDTATRQIHDCDVLAMMKSVDSTYFEPGTKFRYSNSAYAVLTMIVEKISGKSYPEFLKDNIFQPLGMTNSMAFVNGKNRVPNRAFGYHVTSDSIEFSDQSSTSAVLGDGGIYSSIEDLFKWDQALYTEKLLPDSLFEIYTHPTEITEYGFGWHIGELDGHYRMTHTGSTCGFRNVIQRYPDDKLTVLILTNRREPDVGELSNQIATLYLQ